MYVTQQIKALDHKLGCVAVLRAYVKSELQAQDVSAYDLRLVGLNTISVELLMQRDILVQEQMQIQFVKQALLLPCELDLEA